MSRFFGEIRQVAYLVPDIEDAMRYWTEVLGVGPFYYNPKVPIVNYTYRGEPHEPHNSVALANAGGLQIELLQTRNDVPSMYRDFQRAGFTGVQHFAYWTENFDADLARATQEGFEVCMTGEVGSNGRFVYFEKKTPGNIVHPGTVIELSEVAGPKGRLFNLIREASVGWDGSDPVRAFPDLGTL
ncbi:VOC family protein [Neorhizobium alkalisoli]|jgi:catechol 2,3-dioxygenase-like lactoylglutathione lyase family enzyme|uniref:Glyoxalase/bleomycin resistance protein/dioxygenase superfamily protein n=1 Tax=Neorhizobium alkalisoli TaxID=528178 RepID=A0A561QAR5_9HYPH|nr:VOC family protein [Neorhizobium alkalisoli]TWF47458.1 glyoxalase/bleomycin resistance protein/dioxygenase superfamily protein [Neorhizobium alkalisoli]